MRTERPTCRKCVCVKVCEYFQNENARNLDETCPLCNWENYFVPKQEWISVEERLPSEDEQRDEYGELVPFLVCEKDTKYPYRAFYDGTIWGDGLMKIKGITHWMPLPEAPKKGGGE